MKAIFLTDYRKRTSDEMVKDLNQAWMQIKALDREKTRISVRQQEQEALIDKLKGRLWLVMAFSPLLAAALVSFIDWLIR